MTAKVPCYLHTLRKKWELTQKELASLVPNCRRGRVSDVERGNFQPNARELIAYALIFGVPPEEIFPKYAGDIEDAVMRGAAELDIRLAKDDSLAKARKKEFLAQLSIRATLEADDFPNS